MDSKTRAAAMLLLIELAWLSPATAWADGWHNVVLTTLSLDDWLTDVKRAIPDVMKRLDSTELVFGQGLEALRKRAKQGASSGDGSSDGSGRLPRRTGAAESELTLHQQALLGRKARDCLEVLAFMKPENVLIEYPNFPVEQIPEYRDAAAKLLRMMGHSGVAAVVRELRAALMGTSRVGADSGLDDVNRACLDYEDVLLKVLKDAGDRGLLSTADEKSLREAAAGEKPVERRWLVRKLLETLDELDVNTHRLPELVELLSQIKDLPEHHALLGRIYPRLPSSTTEELLDLLKAQPPAALHQATIGELEKRFAKAGVLQLLEIQAECDDAAVDRRVAAELAGRSPRYAEVKDDMAAIVKFASDDSSPLSDAARRQVANAFQRAPMRQTLLWLGKVDDNIQALIWRQIEGRIARADRTRRALYREVAIECLADKSAERKEQLAACELLERLDVSLVVGPLVDALPRLPPEIWPRAGDVLRKLTGQDIGPRSGDGVEELIGQLDEWRKWLQQHPDVNGK